ncbi:hypothetical protein [Clostridium sp.]|nr:hypothetical protein [Clostridium sp.]
MNKMLIACLNFIKKNFLFKHRKNVLIIRKMMINSKNRRKIA